MAKRTYPKITEERIVVAMPARDLEALDAYCAARRRATGELAQRAGIVREAIRRLIEAPVGEGAP